MVTDPTFLVTVTVYADASRPPLLSIASILHRRHVTVLDAELRRAEGLAQKFIATVAASTERMETLARSLSREIDVLSVDYAELPHLRDTSAVPHTNHQLVRRNS